jgi:hypothetical protein
MRRNYTISYFICPECGKALPLPRNKCSKRKKNHIKDLYCVYCKKIVKTVEIRENDHYIKDDIVVNN